MLGTTKNRGIAGTTLPSLTVWQSMVSWPKSYALRDAAQSGDGKGLLFLCLSGELLLYRRSVDGVHGAPGD